MRYKIVNSIIDWYYTPQNATAFPRLCLYLHHTQSKSLFIINEFVQNNGLIIRNVLNMASYSSSDNNQYHK